MRCPAFNPELHVEPGVGYIDMTRGFNDTPPDELLTNSTLHAKG